MNSLWQLLRELLVSMLPALLVVAVAALVLRLVYFRGDRQASTTRFREQLATFVVVLAGLIGVLLTLPLDGEIRGQLLTLLGLLLTAVVTLSSSTIAANAMAGVMLRSLKSYSPGDFISVGDHFGRVTEQDLFHTEIQTQDRDLLTLPNLYLATNPVKVVHATGTIVSAEVSLGYDIDYHTIEPLLITAAEEAGLNDPFVYIMLLGDFSVSYRVSGFLPEVKHLLSVRSGLHKRMLNQLHGNGIEIVSPAFMNQRQVAEKAMPKLFSGDQEAQPDSEPEKMIFDKADRAQQINDLTVAREDLQRELEQLQKEENPDKEALLEKYNRRLQAMERALAILEEKNRK